MYSEKYPRSNETFEYWIFQKRNYLFRCFSKAKPNWKLCNSCNKLILSLSLSLASVEILCFPKWSRKKTYTHGKTVEFSIRGNAIWCNWIYCLAIILNWDYLSISQKKQWQLFFFYFSSSFLLEFGKESLHNWFSDFSKWLFAFKNWKTSWQKSWKRLSVQKLWFIIIFVSKMLLAFTDVCVYVFCVTFV